MTKSTWYDLHLTKIHHENFLTPRDKCISVYSPLTQESKTLKFAL